MPCVECGKIRTVRAHIQAAALGKDIIKRSGRRTLSLAAPNRINNSFQSGIFDEGILCSDCDGKLGAFDAHAVDVCRLLGTKHEVIDLRKNRFTVTPDKAIHHEQLALYGAAVVLRTSLSSYHELARFSLGNNEAWFRDMVFGRLPEIPTVLIARLVGANNITHEAAANALSYPVRIKIREISLARFVTCGLLFLVQTTRAVVDTSILADAVTTFGKSSGAASLTGALYPFEKLADLKQVEKSKYVQHILNAPAVNGPPSDSVR